MTAQIKIDAEHALIRLQAIMQEATEVASQAGVDVSKVEQVPQRRARPGPYGFSNLAAQTYKERELRAKFFEDELFGEPAWNMLLDLFHQVSRGRVVSITSACIASRVPATTALRWVGIMIDQGLVERSGDPIDRRRAFLSLTPGALTKLNQYFSLIDEQRR